MTDFINFLNDNPAIMVVLASAIVATILMYLVAFLQGREISFWPPKIGSKLAASETSSGSSNRVANSKIDTLLVPNPSINIHQVISAKLSTAKSVRICGWSMRGMIDKHRQKLRELVNKGGDLRIILLDPQSSTVTSLDTVLSASDPAERKIRNWPPIVSEKLTQMDLQRVMALLQDNSILRPEQKKSGKILKFCNSLLPVGMFMIEGEDGSAWATIQMYPIHPDITYDNRLTFVVDDSKSKVWKLLIEQFDLSWEDPAFSYAPKE